MLTNRKPERRRGKVQLIDATPWRRPLRKNLGKKTCELASSAYTRPMNRSTFALTMNTPMAATSEPIAPSNAAAAVRNSSMG